HAIASVIAAISAPRYIGNRAVVLIAPSPRLSLVSLVAFGHPAPDVEDDRVTLPVLHQLVLPQVAEERLLDKLDAPELHQRRVVLELPVEDHAHLPRPRKDIWIAD